MELYSPFALRVPEVVDLVADYLMHDMIARGEVIFKGSKTRGSQELLATLLLLGPPGIGKTAAIRDGANEFVKRWNKLAERGDIKCMENGEVVPCKPFDGVWIYDSYSIPEDLDRVFVLIPFRLDMVKPEDLSGIPYPTGREYEYLVPKWAKVLRECRAGLLFLDEFTNAPDDILSAAYEITLNRSINLYRFNKPVIAAGNPPEWSPLARPLPEPLRTGRLIVITVRPPTVEEWRQYMERVYGDEWDRRAYYFLLGNCADAPECSHFLSKPDVSDPMSPFPSPRAWSKLARELYLVEKLGKKEHVVRALIMGALGRRVGTEFLTFIHSNPVPPERLATDEGLIELKEVLNAKDPMIRLGSYLLTVAMLTNALANVSSSCEGCTCKQKLNMLVKALNNLKKAQFMRGHELLRSPVSLLVRFLGDKADKVVKVLSECGFKETAEMLKLEITR